MRSRNQLLLSMAFIATMLLEWLGTGIGNWHWTANVPFVGLHSANPPSGVGLLYVLLDTVTIAICSSTVLQRAFSSGHVPVNLAAPSAVETAWDGAGDFFVQEVSTVD